MDSSSTAIGAMTRWPATDCPWGEIGTPPAEAAAPAVEEEEEEEAGEEVEIPAPRPRFPPALLVEVAAVEAAIAEAAAVEAAKVAAVVEAAKVAAAVEAAIAEAAAVEAAHAAAAASSRAVIMAAMWTAEYGEKTTTAGEQPRARRVGRERSVMSTALEIPTRMRLEPGAWARRKSLRGGGEVSGRG